MITESEGSILLIKRVIMTTLKILIEKYSQEEIRNAWNELSPATIQSRNRQFIFAELERNLKAKHPTEGKEKRKPIASLKTMRDYIEPVDDCDVSYTTLNSSSTILPKGSLKKEALDISASPEVSLKKEALDLTANSSKYNKEKSEEVEATEEIVVTAPTILFTATAVATPIKMPTAVEPVKAPIAVKPSLKELPAVFWRLLRVDADAGRKQQAKEDKIKAENFIKNKELMRGINSLLRIGIENDLLWTESLPSYAMSYPSAFSPGVKMYNKSYYVSNLISKNQAQEVLTAIEHLKKDNINIETNVIWDSAYGNNSCRVHLDKVAVDKALTHMKKATDHTERRTAAAI